MANTIILALILFFVIALFYCVQKGFNQLITALNSIHEQLRKPNERK